mgnify:CR=1 FL=1
MKRLLILFLFVSAYSFSQNDSISFKNPSKVDVEKIKHYKSEKMNLFKDDFSEVKKYQSQSKLGGERLWARILVTKDVGVLMLDFLYRGESWLFMDKAQLKINDNIFEIELVDVSRNTSLGGVSEFKSVVVNEKLFSAISKIDYKEDKVKLRLSGEKQRDFNIYKHELKKLKRTIDFYQKIILENK